MYHCRQSECNQIENTFIPIGHSPFPGGESSDHPRYIFDWRVCMSMRAEAWLGSARHGVTPHGLARKGEAGFMRMIHVTIKGCTPLLQHRFTEQAEIPGATRPVLTHYGTPREQAASAVHTDKSGRFYFPGTAIARLLKEAGANHKLKGSRRSTKFIVPAAVLIMNDAIVLHDMKGIPLKDFEVDSRPVVIPATKGRVMRHRARFDEWFASFMLRINDNVLPVDFIQKLLTEGGEQIGIGAFRPEKGGPFGTFT